MHWACPSNITVDRHKERAYNFRVMSMIDINGKELKVGTVVRVKGRDFEEGVIVGFDDDAVDVIELGDGWTLDVEELEAISEIGD